MTRGTGDTDRIDLIIAPLIRRRRPIAVVARDAALLTTRLSQAQREMTVGALLGLSYPDINDDVAIAILGELGMTTRHIPRCLRQIVPMRHVEGGLA